MSKARSPRDVCSTTIGTNGLMPLLCCLSRQSLRTPSRAPSADTHAVPVAGLRSSNPQCTRSWRDRVRAHPRVGHPSGTEANWDGGRLQLASVRQSSPAHEHANLRGQVGELTQRGESRERLALELPHALASHVELAADRLER